jgi:alpha-glucoside transport system permease protein
MTAVTGPVGRALAAFRPRRADDERRGGGWPINLTIVGLMILWLIPSLGLLVNSFRPGVDFSRTGWWSALLPPWNFTTENYVHVLTRQGLGDAFVNSLIITIPSATIPILVAAFAAYAFAWMSFPGRNILFVAVVGLLVVPLQSTIIPVLTIFRETGLAGSFVAVWLAHTAYGLPFAIYLLRNYMGGLPREVFESAAIDGAGPATAFFRLALPMSVPVIASLAIFQFVFVWNDLLVALIYIGATNAENQPLTLVVSQLVQSTGSGVQYLPAAAFISMILPVAVFLLLQRYFVRGITGGAVKG